MSSPILRTGTRTLAGAQGLSFLATGAWPLIHIESFLAVTGPKTDYGWFKRSTYSSA